MEGLGQYTALLFRVCRKDFKYWFSLLLLCAGLLFLFHIKLPDAKGAPIGVIYPDTPVAEAVFDRTAKEDNGFFFVRYRERSAMEKDLLKGQLDCAFIFPEDFDMRLENGELRDSLLCLDTPFTAKSALACEYLYAGILQQYSPFLVKKEMHARLRDKEETAALDALLERETAAFLESDVLFSVEIIGMETASEKKTVSQERTAYLVRGMAGILLFLFAAFELLGRRRDAYAGFSELLNKRNRRCFHIALYIAETAAPYLLVTVLLVIWEKGFSLPVQALKGIICLAVIGVYILLLWKLRLKKEYIPVTVLGLSLLWIVINPVITDISIFVPAVRYLRFATPVYWML